MKVVPNIPFRITPTNISSQHVHVPQHMIIGELWNYLAAIFDLNQLHPTSKNDIPLAAIVRTVQSDNEIVYSSKATVTQPSDDNCQSINIPGDYAAYRHDFNRMLEPIKSMWDERLGLITTTTHRVDLDSPTTRPDGYFPYSARPRA